MSAPEWKDMADWSSLPDVYLTKAECAQGMFWRIEACSVPMAIGPEVRLIRADEVQRLIAEAVARERGAVDKALEDMDSLLAINDISPVFRDGFAAGLTGARTLLANARNRKETT